MSNPTAQLPEASAISTNSLPSVDVVVPAHNEQAVLASSIRRLHDYLTYRLGDRDRRKLPHDRGGLQPGVRNLPQGTRPNLQRGIRPGFGNDGPPAAGGAAQGQGGAFDGDGGFGGAPAGGGGMFGRGQSLTEALAYVEQHGGGTLTVSSQTGAASQLITSPADVAGIGGFSGRESQVSIEWLADAVQSGRIRWVLTDGTGRAMPSDSRAGSNDVMAAATKVGTPTSVDGLYDLRGHAADLRALAN